MLPNWIYTTKERPTEAYIKQYFNADDIADINKILDTFEYVDVHNMRKSIELFELKFPSCLPALIHGNYIIWAINNSFIPLLEQIYKKNKYLFETLNVFNSLNDEINYYELALENDHIHIFIWLFLRKINGYRVGLDELVNTYVEDDDLNLDVLDTNITPCIAKYLPNELINIHDPMKVIKACDTYDEYFSDVLDAAIIYGAFDIIDYIFKRYPNKQCMFVHLRNAAHYSSAAVFKTVINMYKCILTNEQIEELYINISHCTNMDKFKIIYTYSPKFVFNKDLIIKLIHYNNLNVIKYIFDNCTYKISINDLLAVTWSNINTFDYIVNKFGLIYETIYDIIAHTYLIEVFKHAVKKFPNAVYEPRVIEYAILNRDIHCIMFICETFPVKLSMFSCKKYLCKLNFRYIMDKFPAATLTVDSFNKLINYISIDYMRFIVERMPAVLKYKPIISNMSIDIDVLKYLFEHYDAVECQRDAFIAALSYRGLNKVKLLCEKYPEYLNPMVGHRGSYELYNAIRNHANDAKIIYFIESGIIKADELHYTGSYTMFQRIYKKYPSVKLTNKCAKYYIKNARLNDIVELLEKFNYIQCSEDLVITAVDNKDPAVFDLIYGHYLNNNMLTGRILDELAIQGRLNQLKKVCKRNRFHIMVSAYALKWIAYNGNFTMIKYLCKNNLAYATVEAIHQAIGIKHTEIAKYLYKQLTNDTYELAELIG